MVNFGLLAAEIVSLV